MEYKESDFTLNPKGLNNAKAYLKTINKLEDFRQHVPDNSLAYVEYAIFCIQGIPNTYFLPKEGKKFKSAFKAKQYLRHIEKLDDFETLIPEEWEYREYATRILNEDNAGEYFRKIADRSKEENRQAAKDLNAMTSPQGSTGPVEEETTHITKERPLDTLSGELPTSSQDELEPKKKKGLIASLLSLFFYDAGTSGETSPGQSSVIRTAKPTEQDMTQCKHCGRFYNRIDSVGYKSSMELFTCDTCYGDGKRDWAGDYHDENTF